MNTIRIATNFNIELEFATAPFHRRLIAWAIDLTLQVFYLILASKAIRWITQHNGNTVNDAYNLWAVGLLFMVPFFLYHVLSEITLNGQIAGKKIMRISVVNENGGKPSLSQFIIRWLIKTSDYTLLIIILYAPYAMAYGARVYWAVLGSVALLITDIFLTVGSKKAQRLGDILAHTILIKQSAASTINDTVFLELNHQYQASFPQVMQLSDRDINALKDILDTAQKNHNFSLAANASEKLKKHLHIETTLAPFDFLETLLKDYNYLVVQ
jgi:uncharacterized RDD family membrane protein YckC